MNYACFTDHIFVFTPFHMSDVLNIVFLRVHKKTVITLYFAIYPNNNLGVYLTG